MLYTDKITIEALKRVVDTAKKSLALQVPGYVFIGAWPEAEKAGYTKGSIEFDLFTSHFLTGLPEGIPTNEKGEILAPVLPVLPNGAFILSIDYLAGVVLAVHVHIEGRGNEFITWEFYRGDLRSTANGHYFDDAINEARADYVLRVANSSTRNRYPAI